MVDGNGVLETDYLAAGGEQALADRFSFYRERLERMVEYRLDRRLLGRIDSADILQDAYLEIARRIGEYLANPAVSFFVWARQITWQTLLAAHRRHLGQKRHAGRDVSLLQGGTAATSSFPLADRLVARLTSPSHVVMRAERMARLHEVIERMDDIDREILLLRHFEQLNNSEAAEILGLKKTAASNRYVRALRRLKDTLDGVSDFRGSVG